MAFERMRATASAEMSMAIATGHCRASHSANPPL
jgi:hypothetical protein